MERTAAGGEFGMVGRIGWTLCTLSALAFALQGLLPVDAHRGLDYGIGRLNTAAWTVWWIAFGAGAVALAAGAGTHPALRRTRIATLIAAVVVLALSFVVAIPVRRRWGSALRSSRGSRGSSGWRVFPRAHCSVVLRRTSLRSSFHRIRSCAAHVTGCGSNGVAVTGGNAMRHAWRSPSSSQRTSRCTASEAART
jgi:hypothetical protein